MADHPTRSGGGSRHLDASGPREVVYCHQCDNEWYQDESGLSCPRCQSEITEIVRNSGTNGGFHDSLTTSQITAESDPRPANDESPTPPGFHSLHNLRNHNPWVDSDFPDSDEADIEEHVTQGPGGSVLFSRTIRTSNAPRGPGGSSRRRDPMPQEDPDHVMRDFQNMIGNMMGPGFRPGQPGRSGPDTLFTQGPYATGFRVGGSNGGPQVVGGRFTFTTTTGPRLRPRDANGPQRGSPPPIDDLATYDSPSSPNPPNGRSLLVISIRAPPDELARLIGGIFGPVGHDGQPPLTAPGLPASFQALFSAMLNPANARSGDAVYTQEALDQIISTLMEQHPTSNAPGPASPDAIAALPKKKLDEKLLGPEGKGECSVCMDDVAIGDEVVLLPCNHWFHETCAGAWLSEHNTCPICRKGIDGEAAPSNSRRSSQSAPNSRNEYRSRRLSAARMPLRRADTGDSARNQARLDAIRGLGRVTPPEEGIPGDTRRWQPGGEGREPQESDDYAMRMPGSFSNSYRRPSETSETRRRGNISGSDRSRDSRRNSHSGGSGGSSSGGGPMSWLRDRLGGSHRRND
jgi:E3 ubiquitin-protein ligase RNF115/126